ncbi:histidine kinase [Candidatus Endobugula sertula]|uniref:histidine kinase n=1 Tax=Candidatus Endobugula sertula TaxID=62101 RepID=A0A1D2QTA6_9GAMM|nr:histidine kinase [Candidatus Endobugula sertula]
MNFTLSHIAIIGIIYLGLLFGVAYATNRRLIPTRITRHPFTYILSLGVFFSAWTYYGVIDLANEYGYSALAYYMGTGALFLFAPIVQAPLTELCQRFQLRSIADLLVFRYNSQVAGTLTTFCIALAILPMMAIQIQFITDTSFILVSDVSSDPDFEEWIKWLKQGYIMAFVYCLIIAIFCMTFGASYGQYRSLITTMAFDSLIKICALLAIGLFAVYGVFGSLDNLDLWLNQNPERLNQLYHSNTQSSFHNLLLVFLSASILMPHIFHMNHIDMSTKQLTHLVTWAFPTLLLIVALPVFPILWAGFKLDLPDPMYFTLSVPMQANSVILTIIAYIGGVSAASGALVVVMLSLSTMIANHWVLPLFKFKTEKDIYAQLRWLQRISILGIALISYAIYRLIDNDYGPVHLAFITFIQALQFLPGVFAICYFPSANRYGFYSGIIAGTLIWAIGFVLPLFLDEPTLVFPLINLEIPIGIGHWENITIITLATNIIIFALVSRFTTTSDEEHYHAEICAEDELSRPFRRSLDIHSAKDFKLRLADSIGNNAANHEVNKALKLLNCNENETRPYALRHLRIHIQANLASLMGQTVATELMDKHFPYSIPQTGEVLDINLMETRLDRMNSSLFGLTADVNQLRLYYRETLQELPMAICSLGMDDEILLWNSAMTKVTQIINSGDNDLIGSNINSLPEPWGQLIFNFANSNETHINKQAVDSNGLTRWYRFHKSAIQETSSRRQEGQAILVEDITEFKLLEQEVMHNTRLASIGRLAAGVAHEIGNPVTGIACLAQNLQYDNEEDSRQETATAILSQTDRISRIVQSLVTFAHTGQASQKDFHKVALRQCIDEAIHLLSLQTDRKQIEYSNLVADDIYLWGDTQRIIQVFINLLSNANDASPDYSTVTITAKLTPSCVHINVCDEGTGIPQEHLDQIMDPFFTTKEAGEGTGLGLSVVFSVIEEHQGHIDVTSPTSHHGGTCFTIKLPLYSEALETIDQPLHTSMTDDPPSNE